MKNRDKSASSYGEHRGPLNNNNSEESTTFVLDVLPGDSGGNAESCLELSRKLQEMIKDKNSDIYKGVVSRWIEASSFEIVDEESLWNHDEHGFTESSSSAAKGDSSRFAEGSERHSAVEKGKKSLTNPLMAIEEEQDIEFKDRTSSLPSHEELKVLEESSSIPETESKLDAVLQQMAQDWAAVWTINRMLGKSIKHGRRNVRMSVLTMQHRKRIDMISGDPHLIRPHAVAAFINLLSPAWRVRLLYGQLMKELNEAKSHGSALRTTSYGTELALCAAVNSMSHLNRSLSSFLVDITQSLTPAHSSVEARILEVDPEKVSDKEILERNQQELLQWCDKMVTAIVDSGSGSSDFQLVVNSLFAAVSKKFPPPGNATTTPRSSTQGGGGFLKPNILQMRNDDVVISRGSTNSTGIKSVPATPRTSSHGVDSGVLRLIGGFVFLRLLNPKLLYPSGLLEAPDEENGFYNPQRVLEALEGDAMRTNIKLLCKVLMTSSNNKLYPSSSHLAFLNPWLRGARSRMDMYLAQFCRLPDEHLSHLESNQNNKLASYHLLQMRKDLRQYLLLLLPEEGRTMQQPCDKEGGGDDDDGGGGGGENMKKNMMPGVSREGNLRKVRIFITEAEIKQKNNRTARILQEIFMLLSGMEYVSLSLERNIPRGTKDSEFEAKMSVTSDMVEEKIKEEAESGQRSNYVVLAHAPMIFMKLQNVFGVLMEQIMVSLAINLPYADIVHSKKSGGAFIYTYDKRFIIKNQSETEFKYFLSLLKPYYQHVRDNKDSLLARILGMYEITYHGKTSYWVVMANVCYGQQILHSRYDLKATSDRTSSEMERRQAVQVLKDRDFQDEGLRLAHAGGKVVQQLKNDIKWLVKHRIQGYRLIVGVYVERTMESQRKLFEESGHHGHYGLLNNQEVWALNEDDFQNNSVLRKQRALIYKMSLRLQQKLMQESENLRGSKSSGMADSTLRESTIFHGIPSTPVERKGRMRKRVVYVGIIDIMREYNTKRKLENFWRRTILWEGDQHSAIAPKSYGERMIRFVSQHLKW